MTNAAGLFATPVAGRYFVSFDLTITTADPNALAAVQVDQNLVSIGARGLFSETRQTTTLTQLTGSLILDTSAADTFNLRNVSGNDLQIVSGHLSAFLL